MGIIEPLAPSAAQPVRSGEILAYPSTLTREGLGGTAGTAAGTVEPFSTPRLSEAVVAWAQSARQISRGTLERLGVGSGTVFFPDAGARHEAIVFRYADGWKGRSIAGKHHVSGKGFKLSFWNLEAVIRANPKRVYITEGEFDALALVEAGISPTQVLSVPNGAKLTTAEDPADRRGYDYVRDALKAGLNRAQEIVWCGDSDEPGRVLREDMARMFGAAKFNFVEWPEGTKDANDYLRTDGPEILKEIAELGSLPWPVAGLYRMAELPEPAPMVLWHPGFPEWEKKVMLAPRTMSVVTGHPGHGKTAMWAQIWFQIVRAYAVPMCVATFETRPKPHYRRRLRSLFIGKLEKDMNDDEIRRADAWINERYLFLVHPDQRPTLSWFLEMAEVAVIRHGARIIQVDPWNRMEAERPPGESETEYIGRCLREIHSFAHDMNCHVQILAHPAKMDSKRRGEAPGLEDISGSKNWENMVDQGFVVHRPTVFDGSERQTNAQLIHRKARFDELGYPCALEMDYSLKNDCYRSTDYDGGRK